MGDGPLRLILLGRFQCRMPPAIQRTGDGMKRRLIALAVVGAVTVGLLVVTVGASPARPFVGLNAYELATDYGVNNGCGSDIHTSTDAFFASLPTGTVVRFWAMQPFGTASANTQNPGSLTWGPLDNVFATAAKYGDKLIPVLGNQWGDCDGVNEAPGVQLGQAFYSGGYTSNTSEGPLPYWQWVKDIVARYASSPAVYAWEPINEPQVCDVTEAQATTDLTSFFTAVGGEIHALAPGSKVESGFLGTGTCGLENGDYQTVGASPGLDILTYHDYYPPPRRSGATSTTGSRSGWPRPRRSASPSSPGRWGSRPARRARSRSPSGRRTTRPRSRLSRRSA